MLRMKLRNGLRIAALACVVALALTAAYYYGVARAQSVVALPTSISLTAPGGAGTTLPAATTGFAVTTLPTPTTAPAVTRPASTPTTPSTTQSGTGRPSTTATTARAPRPTQSASSPATRQLVTPIRGWDCEPHSSGSASAGGGGTGTTNCW